MYKIVVKGSKNTHEYEELVKIFLRPDEFEISGQGLGDFVFNLDKDKNTTKKEIFKVLESITGKTPPWGIVTGIRPVKMTGELLGKLNNKEDVENKLKDYYCISEEKIKLALDMYEKQIKTFSHPEKNSASVYIGIPFCPTRCLYCSFASNTVDEEEISIYLKALQKEIEAIGKLIRDKEIKIESVYIGGGTPSVLLESEISQLFNCIFNNFPKEKIKEITFEAGRPDTITKEKLQLLSHMEVDRISINPQTMHDKTLEKIGRSHSKSQVVDAFKMAQEIKALKVNADIIAGLPGESLEDFQITLKEILELKPEGITVHSLALKRASKLVEMDNNFHYKQEKIVGEMLKYAKENLKKEGYEPYYLYRQKQMAGAQENIGYAKIGKECLYNVRIMDEHQSIIAFGAGGISKIYYPDENRLERVPNVTNYSIYIERIDEMIERKLKSI